VSASVARPAGDAADLTAKAAELRISILRQIAAARAGHPGSSLSAVEILTVLYYSVMRHRPAEPDWPERDRFVLSKGHAAPLLYAVLMDLGVLPRELETKLRALGSPLQGHPDARTPGVEIGSGSLGQAFSASVGLAYGLALASSPARVYTLLGDGECQEGQVWEGAAAAAHLGLGNLTVIVDANGIQHDGHTAEIMGGLPLGRKWRAFGWRVREVDGHDCVALQAALDPTAHPPGEPLAVIAATVKGRGVSFMEGDPGWHSVSDAARLPEALRELVDRA